MATNYSRSKLRKLGAGMESLEMRRLMAADIAVGLDLEPEVSTAEPAAEVAAAPTSESSRVLEAVPSARLQNGILEINGTDEDNRQDVIVVSDNGRGFLTVQMQKRDGATLISSESQTFFKHFVNRIVIRGHRGNDTFLNLTNVFSMQYGGEGNDVMQGGSSSDIMFGDGGNDRMSGGSGTDSMYGGRDDDTMMGDGDRDYMYGEHGRDYMRGGFGDDYMDGGDHADRIYGDYGGDTIFGRGGRDYLYGDTSFYSSWGDGDDRIWGGDDSDVIYGMGGNDWLQGEDGYDSIYGGAGRDSLKGGDHRDWLDGGSGNDFLDGGYDGYNDYLTGGSGRDTFVRHRRVFGGSEYENVRDYNSREDHLENDWHW